MKRQWRTEELVEQWSVEPGDKHLLFHKPDLGDHDRSILVITMLRRARTQAPS
jgi:hypothetical protein